jgi:hypothetical protein
VKSIARKQWQGGVELINVIKIKQGPEHTIDQCVHMRAPTFVKNRADVER